MPTTARPPQVGVYVALLLASALCMALLGWSASAYCYPAACLVLQAALLWRGRGFALFKSITLLNQISGLVLVLVLWLGDGLGYAKLDISAAMLLVNLACGGPLMSILAAPLMPALHRGKRLFQWFHPQAA